MLQLIVNVINPTTRVGVSNFKMELQSTTLQKHNNNVQEIIDFMEANYKKIVAHTFTHPNYTVHLFNALLTSKNDICCCCTIQRLKYSWGIGQTSSPKF